MFQTSFGKRRNLETMNQLKIAFGFEARVGKDTAVNHLIKNYGGTHLSFAKPLYDIQSYTQKICGLPQEKDRRFLQIVGTDWGREKNPNIWVDIVLKQIQELGTQENIFISDLRFPNELEALKNSGFTTIYITRTEGNRLVEFASDAGGSLKHSSETSLRGYEQKFDYHIKNHTTLDQFLGKIDNIAKGEL
jgi:Deoxynucleotide monophosphate kinase